MRCGRVLDRECGSWQNGGMIQTERIALLTSEVEVLDQILLDVDPDTDAFWELTALKDRKLDTIARLRTFTLHTQDAS